MRILFIIPYMPNLIRVRSYNLLRSLADRGHQVTLLTLAQDEAEADQASALADCCEQTIVLPISRWRSLWNCLVALPSSTPLQSVYSWQPALAGRTATLVNGNNGHPSFDVVHVEHLRGARYGLYVKNLSENGSHRLPIIWDSVDCITSLFEQATNQSQSLFGRWVTRLELSRTRGYEGYLVNQFERVLVTSPADKRALATLASSAKQQPAITVLSNGVDLDYFRPAPEMEREPATLVVSGKMSYHANVTMVLHLVRDILPRVWQRRPEVKLIVVGKDPPLAVRKLAEHPAVTVTGLVEDMRPYLQRASTAVVPLTYSAGIQNKVLEAMACSTPVIASPQAARALSAESDRDLLVAHDAPEFSARILELLDDPDRQLSLGAQGRDYVESYHNWKTIAVRLEDIYRSAARQSRLKSTEQ
ncbi:MAG: glycosyltransferase [Chloroflexota bacterium]|nr:MAG: glycosyltransferase [Chloroflexota bacterium]